ncbi:murein hydrolase activator EnvC family protein [Fictibacillus phosphorivorans]|uniref:murein hydrolase activator EnvC family protein n=1 Tax=Fictibacillus phosphorivorans TaxID=1221500 RepID=UPI002041CB99|nr:M23 family metallopeptidase [Fictibacillus phosphorivorans]MCM3720059.1 peptidoglycan DD-metalloendopeptidase family protein [Fictibacillus phosphorivorans]MCM3777742.1 peptidoglycan DD-metalloendopeptidase family protein [Fictibacillus phosphorivorans]
MKSKVVGTVLSFSLALSAFTVYHSESVVQAESLSSIKKKQQENQKKAKSSKSKIDQNKKSQASLESEIARIDKLSSDTDAKIEKKKADITQTKNEIAKLKAEIVVVQKRIDKRDKLLKERVNSMYESGGAVSYLEVVLGSKDFGDFLDRVLALNMIAEQDRQLLEEQKKDKELLEGKMTSVEKKLNSLQDAMKDLQGLKEQLKAQKAEKDRLMESLQKEQGHLEAEMHKIENEGEILKSQEEAFKREQERARQQEAAKRSSGSGGGSTAPVIGNGMIMKPAAGIISSTFGTRSMGNHKGIDIAQAGTVPIHAAADGTVIRAEYSSSYGNVVYISHSISGQQWTTVYAHMSSTPMVSTGQSVSKGTQLGNMGNTGHSTGQHLHFELHKGPWNAGKTNAVNPAAYW